MVLSQSGAQLVGHEVVPAVVPFVVYSTCAAQLSKLTHLGTRSSVNFTVTADSWHSLRYAACRASLVTCLELVTPVFGGDVLLPGSAGYRTDRYWPRSWLCRSTAALPKRSMSKEPVVQQLLEHQPAQPFLGN